MGEEKVMTRDRKRGSAASWRGSARRGGSQARQQRQRCLVEPCRRSEPACHEQATHPC